MNDELRRCWRFGWTSLAAWALFGLAIETAHGFKLAAYLDDSLRHTVLRLAHAHGVILALVVLAVAKAVAAVETDAARRPRSASPGWLAVPGRVARPVGFALGGIAPHEGDPAGPSFWFPWVAFCSCRA